MIFMNLTRFHFLFLLISMGVLDVASRLQALLEKQIAELQLAAALPPDLANDEGTVSKWRDLLSEEKELPAIDRLFDFLRSKPRVPIHVGFEIHPSPPDWLVCNAKLARHTHSISVLLANIVQQPVIGSGQSTLHSLIDSLTVDVMMSSLRAAAPTLSVDKGRDVVDKSQTTQKNIRPDVLLYVNNALFVRGEEELDGHDFSKAQNELLSKLIWNPAFVGRAPFLIGFAAASTKLQFFALSCVDSTTGRCKSTPISPCLSLSDMSSRLEIFLCALNISRLAPAFAELLPPSPPRLYDKVTMGSTEITVLPLVVHKTVGKAVVNVEELRLLYERLRGKSYPFLVRINKFKINGIIELELSPVGAAVPARSLVELRRAIRHVLQALAVLHEMGFSHNDIAWRNVLCSSSEQYFLIDLEHCTGVNSQLASSSHRHDFWPRAVANDDNILSLGPQTDLYFVASLMDSHLLQEVVSADNQASDLRNLLRCRRSGLTATECLNHAWLQ